METEQPAFPEDRRRFLARVGTTIAAGIGLVVFGADPAGARRRVAGTQACGIYCYLVGCPGNCCGCGHEFRCVNQCDGSESYECLNRGCSSFCLTTAC